MDSSLETACSTIKNTNPRVDMFTCLWVLPQMISFIPIHLNFWAWWRTMMEDETVNFTDEFGHTFELTSGYKNGVPGFVKGVETIAKYYNLEGGCYIFHYGIGPGPLWFDLSVWSWDLPVTKFRKIYQWDVVVQERFAQEKVQLRFPPDLVKRFLPSRVHYIFVIVQELNVYNYVELCTQPTGPKKNLCSRYLGGKPWFDIVRMLNLTGAEKLICTFRLETDVLFLHVVRW